VLYGELNEAQENALENETIIRLVDYAKQKNIDWKKLIEIPEIILPIQNKAVSLH
jgi:hypothetical protein